MMFKTIKKWIWVVFIISFFVFGKTSEVQAASKDIVINIEKEYSSCTFVITYDKAGNYNTELISPSGNSYPVSSIDETIGNCVISKPEIGQWIVRVNNDLSSVGTVKVNVTGSKPGESNVVDNIQIGKDISGLSIYFRNDNVCVEWLDTTCGEVNIQVIDIDTKQVLGSDTVRDNYYSCEIPQSTRNISVTVVPSTSANISGAAQTFNFTVDKTLDATVTYPDATFVNTDTIDVTVTLNNAYEIVVENNGEVVLSEEIRPAGTYSYAVPLIDEGENFIQFFIVDADGNMRSVDATFIKDVTPPTIALDSDYSGVKTSSHDFTICGSVSNYASLTLNDKKVTVATDGRFEYNCNLHDGDNHLILKAIDEAGNEVSYDIVVNCNPAGVLSRKILLIAIVLFVAGYFFLKKIKKKNAKLPKEALEEKQKEQEKILKAINKEKEPLKKEDVEKERTDVILEAEKTRKKKLKSKIDKRILKLIPFVCVFIVNALIFTQVFHFSQTYTESMSPTIRVGEHISDTYLCSRIAYKNKTPQRGDIILFWSESETSYVCKRVIGLPGEAIEFADGYVYINGEKLDESAYLDADVETNCVKSFVVPENGYFVLGDNRENSSDSRFWDEPFVSIHSIYSKVLFIIPTHML